MNDLNQDSIAELYLRLQKQNPSNIIKMVIRSTLAVIDAADTPKRDRTNAKNFAVLIMCGLLEAGLPIPKELAKFCAGYIPKQLKQDKRGAKPKHDQNQAFEMYQKFISDGTNDAGAKKKVSLALNSALKPKDDKTTISKSIDKHKKFLDFMLKLNNTE